MNDEVISYCRLCAEMKPNSKLTNLEDNEEKRREITSQLTRVNATTDLDDNNLPKTICFVCIDSLNRAYQFVIAVEYAQATLSDIVLVQHIKKEETCCDSENSVYEPPDVKYEEGIDVKLESVREDSDSKQESVKKVTIIPRNPKRKLKKSQDLDVIPLSQLKLTWKDFIWVCAYCETQFPNIDELKIHSLQYHDCCNAYRCTDCNIRKLKLDSFLIHVRRHRKFLKYSCYKCSVRFSTFHEANKHKATHIDSEYMCPGCNSTFSSSDDLRKHMESLYKDKRSRQVPTIQETKDSLTCVLCKKMFKHKTSLNTHLLIHTERKRDHTCEKCGKCFLNKQNLAGHMLLHEDVRPHQCEICKYTFKTISQLRSHVGVHDGQKPFECDQCGRCFRLQKQLNSHSIIHTDELPYICSFCNKGFRFKTILNQHIRQHTGIKPYSCEVCQRDFTNWPNYNKHMKRRHSMDMAKKKHTPEGLYPIDPSTGEVIIHTETNKMLEWKKKMMVQKKPGRPKIKSKGDEVKLQIEKNNDGLDILKCDGDNQG